jgi:hypothetical protein
MLRLSLVALSVLAFLIAACEVGTPTPPDLVPDASSTATPDSPTATPDSAFAPDSPSTPNSLSDFTIVQPLPGASVPTETVIIHGIAPADAEVRLDISFAPDESTQADAQGKWEYEAELDEGENELTFFLQEDDDVRASISLTYNPPETVEPTSTRTLAERPESTVTSSPNATPTSAPARTPQPSAAEAARVEAVVVNVLDGGTVDVRFNGTEERLRLIGIDTPETGEGGRRSTTPIPRCPPARLRRRRRARA